MSVGQIVSILYLRCEACMHDIRVRTYRSCGFNSLFEMPEVCRALPRSRILECFNSLFEMLNVVVAQQRRRVKA